MWRQARSDEATVRRKDTPGENFRIVLKGFHREVTVSDLCRREGIKLHSYYSRTKDYLKAGRERPETRVAAGKEYHRRHTGSHQMSAILPFVSYYQHQGYH